MNKKLISGLIFVGGFGIGLFSGWVISKKHFESYMDAMVEQEVEATKDWLLERAEEVLRGNDGEPKELNVEEEDVHLVTETNMGRIYNYAEEMNRKKDDLLRPERVSFQYDGIPLSSWITDEQEDPEPEVDIERLSMNDDNPQNDIYIISPDQFARERFNFDKITLYWWELERILSEEDYDILDVPDLLGHDWERHIGEFEKDVVYIRNENMQADYEVIVQHESFYDMRD